ncbi:MAG: universal stress protein [Dehalococcoidia bacterium]|nr:MAG: universal stress protein [Dehalococcoidia bacterium]
MEFNKILVPVTGTTADDEVIKLACQLAKKSKAKIWTVYVLTVKRTLPLDVEITPDVKKAEEVLDHITIVAEDEGYEVETDLLQAREAGPTIVDEAVEREADLILMGVVYKRIFGQFSLGSVVPYVLQNAPCEVILYHQYTP